MVSKWDRKVQAKCAECGHGWELERGDALVCPFCRNSPETVTMAGSLAVLEWDGTPRFDGRPR